MNAVMTAESAHALPEADYQAWLSWLQRVGIDEVGYCGTLQVLDPTTVLVEFYADEDGLPTREVEAISVPIGADSAERVWATVAIAELPPGPVSA